MRRQRMKGLGGATGLHTQATCVCNHGNAHFNMYGIEWHLAALSSGTLPKAI
jgi:hypothetical protein